MSRESRSQVLRMISEIAGFSFKEEELSPGLRKKITDVAAQLDHYYILDEEEDKESGGACLCGLTGILVLAVLIYGITQGWAANLLSLVFGFGIGIAFIIGGLLLADKEKKAPSLWSEIEGQVYELAKEVESELSAVHEAKVRPTVRHVVIDFARIIEAAKGRGIILDKVECPHCGGTIEIPASGEQLKCKYCGKIVYATNIFDKLKDMLSPEGNSGE